MGPYEVLPLGNRFVLVLMDYVSKWPEIKVVKDCCSTCIVKFLENVFMREGFPQFLVSDDGTQFVSEEFESFLNLCGIKHLKSSLYYPETNGLMERMNRVVGECIKWAVNGKHDVLKSLESMLWFYRTTPHSSTKVPPFELLRGRKASTSFRPAWMSKWLVSETNVESLMEIVKSNLDVVQSKQNTWLDLKKKRH